MLINLEKIRKIFNKNVYNRFISETYGINTSFCEKEIIENDLLINFTNVYQGIDTFELTTIDMNNLAPIIINYITNNVTNNGIISAYTFTQSLLSSTWTINHNLGYKPSKPLITDEDGIEIDGITSNTSTFETIIKFSHPQRGFAYFS
jgi:hypothetical protein